MSLGKSASAVSGATFLSRIFGLVRDQLFAALLGAGFYSDAYVIAFRIPNLLRDLFAEGALSSAFVPTFTEYEVKRSTEEAWNLANLVIGVLLVIVGSLTLLGILFAPQFVSAIAPGFGDIEGKRDLTILLTRIMFPFLPVVSISALLMGMLNVKGKFALPALAPVLFNLVTIAIGILLYAAGVPARGAVIGWSIGTLLGGLAQGGIQVPALWKLGWRFKCSVTGWRESAGLRQIAKLMLPAIIGLSATQVNILVNSILASLLEQGAPSWLNYSFRLMQLPIGIFGVAVGVVTLPRVSRDAAQESSEGLKKNLTEALNLVFVLTIPAALGLWVLSVPIVRLIYEHGHFVSADTLATAGALACYAVGLPAYAAVKVLAPAFYALKSARYPMIASITAVAMNIVFNLAMYKTVGYRGLAFGTSIAALTNFALLLFWFQRKQSGLALREMGERILRIGLAAVAMAFVARTSYHWLHSSGGGLFHKCYEALLPVALAVLTYGAALKLLRVPEVDLILRLLNKTYRGFFSR